MGRRMGGGEFEAGKKFSTSRCLPGGMRSQRMHLPRTVGTVWPPEPCPQQALAPLSHLEGLAISSLVPLDVLKHVNRLSGLTRLELEGGGVHGPGGPDDPALSRSGGGGGSRG